MWFSEKLLFQKQNRLKLLFFPWSCETAAFFINASETLFSKENKHYAVSPQKETPETENGLIWTFSCIWKTNEPFSFQMEWIWWTRNLISVDCTHCIAPVSQDNRRMTSFQTMWVFPSTSCDILLLSCVLNSFIPKRRAHLSLIRQQCVFLSLCWPWQLYSPCFSRVINRTWSVIILYLMSEMRLLSDKLWPVNVSCL